MGPDSDAQVARAFGAHATWGQRQILLQSRSGQWWAATKVGLCQFSRMSAADLARAQPKSCFAPDVQVFRVFVDSTGHVWASGQWSIYEELHVHTRSEAVARALRDGLIH
jgi:hypothetical protein